MTVEELQDFVGPYPDSLWLAVRSKRVIAFPSCVALALSAWGTSVLVAVVNTFGVLALLACVAVVMTQYVGLDRFENSRDPCEIEGRHQSATAARMKQAQFPAVNASTSQLFQFWTEPRRLPWPTAVSCASARAERHK